MVIVVVIVVVVVVDVVVIVVGNKIEEYKRPGRNEDFKDIIRCYEWSIFQY